MSVYSKHVAARSTPQSEPMFGKSQEKNNAGGYTFVLDKWSQLERFLVIGCQGGSYYANERSMAVENAKIVNECADEDHAKIFAILDDINKNNRAIKHDTVLFAYVLLCSKQSSYLDHILSFCRTGTHLFQFAQMIKDLRGWGRSVRRAVARWYNEHHSTEYQMVKYQSRGGWTHRDVLRQSHVVPKDETVNGLLKWAVKGEVPAGGLVEAMSKAKTASELEIVSLINDKNLPRECIPTEHLKSIKVWDALLEKMPMTAMIRNLGKMSSIGLLTPMSDGCQKVASRLVDSEYVKESRIHPFSVLLALKTYSMGQGFRGSLSWSPDSSILESLNTCFSLSFENVEPTGKRFYFGVDVSGSMTSTINNSNVTCREAAAALVLASVKHEPMTYTAGFTGGWNTSSEMTDLLITRQDSLQSVVSRTAELKFGRTDCAMPMLDAMQKKIPVDTFVVITDNETWCGGIHPVQALKQYRDTMGIPAKLIVVGMTATKFSIADPSDAGMLDIAGFDSSAPKVISEFAKM